MLPFTGALRGGLSISAMAPAAIRACGYNGLLSKACRLAMTRGLKTTTIARDSPITPKHRQTHEEVSDYMQRLFDLERKVAFVTGAAGAIGHATSIALARCGADVVMTDVKEKQSKLNELAKEIRGLGREAVTAICDVRDQASVQKAVDVTKDKFGRIDILIANAGILGDMMKPQDMTEENWQNVFSVNVDGVFHTVKASYPLLKVGGKSKVVIMSSIAGLYGYGHQPAYCAAKGALIPLGKSLALAWAKDGINVNLVLPGATNSPFTAKVLSSPEKVQYMMERIPLARLAEPEDIVGAIVFFSSHAADYITGTHLTVDGGGTARAMAK